MTGKMPGDVLEVVRARSGETGEAMGILMEASRWLASRGIDQWPMPWLESKGMRDWMLERAARGELYFAFLKREAPFLNIFPSPPALAGGEGGVRGDRKPDAEMFPVGTFTLVPSLTPRDRSLWGDRPDDGAYLHSLAIRREFSGRGLGNQMVRRAEEMALAAGKRFLRLDCWKENPWLVRWYEGMGFTLRGEGSVDQGRWILSLYEKELS